MLNAAAVAAAITTGRNVGPKGKTKKGPEAKKVQVVEPDKEKRDRAMAKTILDHVGMETEKYRLGYTKVSF